MDPQTTKIWPTNISVPRVKHLSTIYREAKIQLIGQNRIINDNICNFSRLIQAGI